MTLLRALLYNLGFYVWTALLAVLGLPVLLLGRRAVLAFSRFWTSTTLGWLRLTVGLSHELRGLEHLPEGAAIIAPKHQSAWDTLILNLLLPDPAIVYKRELGWIPLFGWYVRAAGMIAVDRRAGGGALRSLLAAAREAGGAGRQIVIFPEGTRGAVGARLPYQAGVGALYSQLDLPLVPVALNSGLFWGRRAFMKRPGRILLEVLPPIPPGLDRRQAIARLEREIEGATARLVAEAGREKPVDKPGDSGACSGPLDRMRT